MPPKKINSPTNNSQSSNPPNGSFPTTTTSIDPDIQILPTPSDEKVQQDGLTPELLAHTTSIALNPKHKDKIIQLYLDGNKEERQVITKMYSQAFEDPQFVQSLIRAGTLRVAQTIDKEFDPNRNSNYDANKRMRDVFKKNSNTGDEEQKQKESSSTSVSSLISGQRRSREENKDGDEDNTNNNNNESGKDSMNNSSSEDLQRRCRTLRKEIDETVCAVSGPGPHKIRFGIAKNQNDIDKLVTLFSQQFVYPGMRELRSTYVKPPQKVSTRHRSIRTGNFCWFIQYVPTGEICCAATVNLLPVAEGNEDRIVFEIPLYATAAGFKRLGLARLLNAAIQELSIFMNAELILISADQNAVPFWTNKNLGGGGYVTLSRGQKDSYQFMYENQCKIFGDTTMLCWTPPRGADALASGLLQDALDKTPKFVVDGPARLPLI